jgi:hypothetical protein
MYGWAAWLPTGGGAGVACLHGASSWQPPAHALRRQRRQQQQQQHQQWCVRQRLRQQRQQRWCGNGCGSRCANLAVTSLLSHRRPYNYTIQLLGNNSQAAVEMLC